jgi:Domain of unknown function (DUF4396)
MIPQWLHDLAIASLVLGFASALIIAIDEMRRPQHMWIMNLVWPITGLYAGVFALWGYFAYGRLATHKRAHAAMQHGEDMPHKKHISFPIKVAKGASHCGSGCTLGDICAEWLAFLLPVIATWFGWKTIFAEKMFAVWIIDYIFAFTFGVAFQYFTIQPMQKLPPKQAVFAALKADAASLTAWQVGMYGFMAVAVFYIFRTVLGAELQVNSPEFWFMMQIAMLCGFATSYPVNWWLIRRGVKEAM